MFMRPCSRKYRGAALIQWAVIDGEKESGATTMMMDVDFDTGDMLEQKAIPLDEKRRAEARLTNSLPLADQ